MQVRPQRYRTLHEVTDLFTKSHRLIHKDMNPSTGDRIVHKDTDSSTEIWIRPLDTRSSTKIQICPLSYWSVSWDTNPLSWRRHFLPRRKQWNVWCQQLNFKAFRMYSHCLRRYVKPVKVSVRCKLFIYNMLKGCTWTYYDNIMGISLSHSYVNLIPSWKWINMSLSQQYTSCRQSKINSFLCCIERRMYCVMRVACLFGTCYNVICVCVNFACLIVRKLSHAQASAEWHSVTGMRIKQQIQRTKRWGFEKAEEPVWTTWWAFRRPRQTSRSEPLYVGVGNDEFLSNVCVFSCSVVKSK